MLIVKSKQREFCWDATVSGVGPAVVVRRRDIESDPRPQGGRFAERAFLRAPASSPLAAVLSVFCVNTTDRVVALTFDDGPHPDFTPKILATRCC